MQSHDIRRLVEKEGKSARNLVAWSVPIADITAPGHESNDGFQQVTKRTRRSRQRARPKPRGYQDTSRRPTHPSRTPSVVVPSTNRGPGPRVSEEVCVVVAEHYSNIHAKQRNRQTKSPKIDLHARYWSYLFDNLHRAVDELYATCEADESPIECQVTCHSEFKLSEILIIFTHTSNYFCYHSAHYLCFVNKITLSRYTGVCVYQSSCTCTWRVPCSTAHAGGDNDSGTVSERLRSTHPKIPTLWAATTTAKVRPSS